MQFERWSMPLLAELYELEEDGYRLALREAKRIGTGPPADALRAIAGHANETLEELPGIARARNVRLGSLRALVLDTIRRIRDVGWARFAIPERAYRRTLTALHRSADFVELVRIVATAEDDDALATWCDRWLRGRERLISSVARQLGWFALHQRDQRADATSTGVAAFEVKPFPS